MKPQIKKGEITVTALSLKTFHSSKFELFILYLNGKKVYLSRMMRCPRFSAGTIVVPRMYLTGSHDPETDVTCLPSRQIVK